MTDGVYLPARSRRYLLDDAVARILGFYGNTSWALADQAIVSGTTFVNGVLVARILGVEFFGYYALIWLARDICTNLHQALVINPLMSFFPNRPGQLRQKYLGAIILQHTVISIVLAAGIAACCLMSKQVFPEWAMDEMALPLAIAVLVGLPCELLRMYFYAIGRPRMSFKVDVMRNGLQLALTLLAVLALPRSMALQAIVYAMAEASGLTALVFAAQLGPVRFVPGMMLRVWRRHWVFARWTLATLGVIIMRDAVTSVAVAALLGLVELGLLRATLQLVLVVNVPLQGLGRLAMPGASVAYTRRGVEGLRDYIRKNVLPYMGLIAGILVLMSTCGEVLVTRVYGAAYAGSGLLFSAFALGLILALIREVLIIKSRAIRRPNIEFHATIVAACVALAAIIPMWSIFGLIGTALCDALFYGVALTIMALQLRVWLPRSVNRA